MANHVRQQIREAVGTLLTGLTTTTTHVHQTRLYQLQESELPCLLIYTKSEQAEINTLSRPRNSYRMLTLTVEIVVKQAADWDDKVDTIAKEVEAALAAAPTLSGLAKDVHLDGTQIDFEKSADQGIGTAEMDWTVEYQVIETAPDVAT